ncbi:MAG: rod shape-determining protein MreD [Ferrimonas sp.]
MPNSRASGRGFLWLTLLIALLLQVMPWPALLQSWRPDWVLLTIIYWVLTLPHRFSILSACLVGVILDALLGATLGMRGLALSIVAFIVALQYQKLRHVPMVQQMVMVAVFTLLYHLLIFVAAYLRHGGVPFEWAILQPALSTMLLWPWAFWLLGRVRRRFKIR